MIESIVAPEMKNKMSDKIARETVEFLARGKVSEIPFGVSGAVIDTYRDHQSKVAKIDAAAKAARESK